MRLALALVTLLLAALSAGALSAGAQAPPIRIGFASAMSGPAAITGEGVRWGATLAVEEINARGGIMGHKIEASFADNKAQPGEAVSAVRKLADVTLVLTEFFDPGQPDYRPVLTRLKRANPETILAVILASDGAPFMRQFRELGLTQRIFSRGSLASAEFLHQVRDNPKVGDGVVEASYWVTGLDPDWDRKWTERYKVPPRIHGSLAAITLKWAVVPAIEIALKKHGKADRQTIRAALKEVDVKDSPLGPIKFDDNHQAWINMILLEMRDGQLRILEKLQTSPALLN